MKRIRAFTAVGVLIPALLMFTACGGKEKVTTGGDVNLLSMIPADAAGVMTMNFEKIRNLDFFKEAVAKMESKQADADTEKAFKSYQDFVNKTGIDLRKDLHAVAVGLFGDFQAAGNDPDFAMVARIDMDRQKILDIVKSEGKELTPMEYKGQEMFLTKDDSGDEMSFAFLSDTLATAGKPAQVKRVIDLVQGQGDSVLKNKEKLPYLEQMKADSVMSFVFDFPEKLKQAGQEGGPFKMDLSKAEMLLGHVDHGGAEWNGELKLISRDEEANKQMVTMLNGLKGMGAMAGPEVAELVGNINLTAAADHIQLAFNISDELIRKLQEKAKQKAEAMSIPEPAETAEPAETE